MGRFRRGERAICLRSSYVQTRQKIFLRTSDSRTRMLLHVSISLLTAKIWLNDCVAVPMFLVAGHRVWFFHSSLILQLLIHYLRRRGMHRRKLHELILPANLCSKLIPSYSTAVTWALFALTQNPTAQAHLREELLSLRRARDSPRLCARPCDQYVCLCSLGICI
jgi:hypothetical protein